MKTQGRQLGFAFENQLTELDSFIKATNLLFFKILGNGCDENERMQCMSALYGTLDQTTKLFEKLRHDMLDFGDDDDAEEA